MIHLADKGLNGILADEMVSYSVLLELVLLDAIGCASRVSVFHVHLPFLT
jgi:hypothetical protein